MARTPESRQIPDTEPFIGPVRTCVGCRGRAAKSELLRVTVGADANGRPAVVPDPDATTPGRGAYLHPVTECYALAVRRRAFGRALRVTADAGGLPSDTVGEYVDSLDTDAHTADRQKTEQQLMSTR